MEGAIIFLVEDDEMCRRHVKMFLEERGHCIALEAVTLEDALDQISEGKLAEASVDLAIVDGFLPRSLPVIPGKKDVWAGPIVAKAIRDTGLGIKIVSHSSLPAYQCRYGDAHVCKADNTETLLNTVAAM